MCVCVCVCLDTAWQAAISIKISNLLICICPFDLSCPILHKDNFIKKYILYRLILLNSVLFLTLLALIF